MDCGKNYVHGMYVVKNNEAICYVVVVVALLSSSIFPRMCSERQAVKAVKTEFQFSERHEDCKYHGVYAYDGSKNNWATSKMKWTARLRIKRLNGEKGIAPKHTYHVTKIEAAKSHDALVMKYYNEGRYPLKSKGKVEKLKLNFPDDYSDCIID
eukprot:g401.t1